MVVEVISKNARSVYSRTVPGAPQGYSRILTDTSVKYGVAGPCHIAKVRAEDDRIMIEIAEGDPIPWFSEKACPPLRSEEDRLLAGSTGTGGWGVNPPTPPMQTRAAAAKNKAVRVVDVLLHNLVTDEMEPIGKATDYPEAIALAHRSGKVPKGWNVAGTEKNDEHIIVVCKRGKIVAGDGVASAVTAPKAKAKKTPILPEKLVGRPKNPPPGNPCRTFL
jgi:hypothetical protein